MRPTTMAAMTETRSTGQQIVDEVTSWPGRDGRHRAAAASCRCGSAGARSATCTATAIAHFGFPKAVGAELRGAGPDRARTRSSRTSSRWGARRIASEDDVRDVIELMRLNYDRAGPYARVDDRRSRGLAHTDRKTPGRWIASTPARSWRPHAVWHWIVTWDLRDREPHHQPTLPHPSAHLVVEEGGAWLYGPLSERFERTLAGLGRAVGLRFRPGASGRC